MITATVPQTTANLDNTQTPWQLGDTLTQRFIDALRHPELADLKELVCRTIKDSSEYCFRVCPDLDGTILVSVFGLTSAEEADRVSEDPRFWKLLREVVQGLDAFYDAISAEFIWNYDHDKEGIKDLEVAR